MVHLPDAFSRDYATAKARFYELSREAGGSLHVVGLDARSPEKEALSIDIAWFGSARPRRAAARRLPCPEGGALRFRPGATGLAYLSEEMTILDFSRR
jgi:hypothetical protein